jgi:hypothetical protein
MSQYERHLQLAECRNGTQFHAMYFPASGASQIRARNLTTQPNLEGISGPLHSPKRKTQWVYIRERGSQEFGQSRPIYLFRKVLFRDSHCKAPVWTGTNLFKENVEQGTCSPLPTRGVDFDRLRCKASRITSPVSGPTDGLRAPFCL